MTLRTKLGLAFVSLLAASGCAHSNRVAAVHVDDPGTHIVTGQGAISIAKNTSGGSRVCTRVLPPPAKGRHGKGKGKGPGPAADPGARLDILLFRLCEARSNGDISAEQYATSVQSIVKSLEQMANRPRMTMAPRPRPDGDERPGWRRRRGFRNWDGPPDDRDEDRGPRRPEPNKDAPK
jgi:hypothetical protein